MILGVFTHWSLDVVIGVHFGKIWLCIVCVDSISSGTCSLEKLVIIVDTIAEMICNLLDREMIEHGKGVRQDEALN